MKKFIPFFLLSLGLGMLMPPLTLAQITVGSTASPGSTLDVRGSVSITYQQVTASSYSMTAADYYLLYTGTAASTFTLPAAGSGNGVLAASFKGRLYSIKNATAAQTLTVLPAGAETINGNASIMVPAGQSVQLVSTGNTSGVTWDIVAFAAATSGGAAAAVTAGNGLSASGGNVTLGGNLATSTTLGLGNNSLTLATGTAGTGTLILDGSGTAKQRLEFSSVSDPNAVIGHVSAPGEVNDLYLYAGNDADGTGYGPDRIRLVGESIVFQSFNNGANNTLANAESNTGTITNLTIGSNGNVGIGTAAAPGRLNVSGAMGATYTGGLNITNTSPIAGNTAIQQLSLTPGFISLTGITGNVPVAMYDLPGMTGSHIFSDHVIPNGNNNYSLGNAANRWTAVYATNGTIQTSDARLKKNVRNLGLGFGLDAVLKLRPVRYDWQDDSGHNKLGFIAQELRQIVPNVVVGDEQKEPLGVLYADLVPVLTKAIQEQQAEIEALKATSTKAKAELQEVQASLQRLAEQVQLLQASGTTAATK